MQEVQDVSSPTDPTTSANPAPQPVIASTSGSLSYLIGAGLAIGGFWGLLLGQTNPYLQPYSLFITCVSSVVGAGLGLALSYTNAGGRPKVFLIGAGLSLGCGVGLVLNTQFPASNYAFVVIGSVVGALFGVILGRMLADVPTESA